MFNRTLRCLILALLWLRYRVVSHGLREITHHGRQGILFLPTHPALIDPVILTAVLLKDFAARPFVNQDAVNLPGIRWLVTRIRAFPIPPISRYGGAAATQITAMVEQSIDALRNGDNIILYPAGYLLHSRYEEVGANAAVAIILRALPDVRVVLVRTRGLWGSSFSQISGPEPNVGVILKRGIWQILANFLLFTPRRQVDLTFDEPADFPRTADRATVNAYLERHYNADAPPAQYVPYTIWERTTRHELPDPEWRAGARSAEIVSTATRELVLTHLRQETGVTTIRDTDRLAGDIGMDSLARAELMVWLEQEFGFPQGNTDSLNTVADVLLAASGEALAFAEVELKPISPGWFARGLEGPVTVPPGETIAACFLQRAKRAPGVVIIADQNSGALSYRALIRSILALLPAVRALPGERVGLMLPASVAACLTYLTIIFAGRVPVLVNWTLGRRNMLHGLELTETQRVITVKPLVARMVKQGVDLSGIEERFVYLEDVVAALTKWEKVRALLGSFFSWHVLSAATVAPTAAILFTSGSESLPKAVPLSHANILADLRDVLPMVQLSQQDSLLALLPPFHSFGLTGNMVAPLIGGWRAVYYANPTEGPILAKIIEAYQATVLLGTPTFLYGILRAATNTQLASMRLAVTGAEECPQRVYDLLTDRFPHITLIEGYGITECAPIVAVNVPSTPRPHTIGRLILSLESVLLHPETNEPVSPGTPGMLLLRGPTVFAGYLGDAPDPFVSYNGQQWYRTGDLVRRDVDGMLTFAGRLKRFIKLGGEMISLAAVESALQAAFSTATDTGPTLAVIATSGEQVELVLVTCNSITREAANSVIRDAGLSALHNIRRVATTEAIPVLGTGKTDYRALQVIIDSGQVEA